MFPFVSAALLTREAAVRHCWMRYLLTSGLVQSKSLSLLHAGILQDDIAPFVKSLDILFCYSTSEEFQSSASHWTCWEWEMVPSHVLMLQSQYQYCKLLCLPDAKTSSFLKPISQTAVEGHNRYDWNVWQQAKHVNALWKILKESY